MANLICCADGNLTDAATWAVAAPNPILQQSSGYGTALTTSNQDTAAFQPGAVTIDAIALKIYSVSATPAAGDLTMTVTLYNSTDAVDVVSLAYSAAELANNGDANRGGWYLFKLDTTYLLEAAHDYKIRLKVSSTTSKPTITVQTKSGGWGVQTMLRTTTTAAPAAGDDMFVLGELASTATWTTRTVTMNQTATTDYGNNAGDDGSGSGEWLPALAIGDHGTVVWGTSATTDYVLKLSGAVVIYPGGTMNMGTTGTPCPRGSSQSLTFDTASSKQFGMYVIGGANKRGTLTMQGLSRTSGKNVWYAKLTANLAANGTSVNVDTDTGWLSGDSVAFAATTGRTHSEVKALSGDASASALAFAAVTNAHNGTAPTQGHVVLLTRNVTVSGLDTTYPGKAYLYGTVDCDWARFKEMSAWMPVLTSSLVDLQYCALSANGQTVLYAPTNATKWTVQHAALTGGTNNWLFNNEATTASDWVFQDIIGLGIGGCGYGFVMYDIGSSTAITDLVSVGASNQNIYCSDSVQTGAWPANPVRWTAYQGASCGIRIAGSTAAAGIANMTFSDFTAWICGTGIQFAVQGGFIRCRFDNMKAYGNSTAGVDFNVAAYECRGTGWDLAGLQANAVASGQAVGLKLSVPAGGQAFEFELNNATLGSASGVYLTHSTTDVDFGTQGVSYMQVYRLKLRNVKLGSGTEFTNTTYYANAASFYSSEKHDQTAATHKRFVFDRGTVAYETTTYVTTPPSIKMTPTSATRKLNSGIMRFPVLSGAARTIKARVRKDGSYNGNAPRLVMLMNSAVGVADDTVLDTLTVGANEWEQLTGSTGSPTDDGVVECYVECDGTAGNIYVDEWEAT